MTAPQDPFSTPPQGTPGSSPGGYGAPTGEPAGYGAPSGPPAGYGAPSGPPAGYGDQPGGYGTQPGGYGGPPPFGSPGGHGPARNGFGITALVLGILALLSSLFFGGFVFGIPAIVFGALGQGRAKRREATNGGMAIAGIVLGVISLLISIAIIALGVSLFNSESGRDYQDCLNSAQDQAAIERCAQEFSEDITR